MLYLLRCRVAILIASFLLIVNTSQPASGQRFTGTPLNSSIVLYNEYYLQRASDALEKAAELGNRRVCFVPTLHVELDSQQRIRRWGFLFNNPTKFVTLDDSLHQQIVERWSALLTRARELQLEITILPHIDAVGNESVWRNQIDVDPLQVYGDFSYAELLIAPLVESLADRAEGSSNVYLALGGEMGRSLFRYPESYRRITERLRIENRVPGLKLGISLNHQDVGNREHLSDSHRRHLQRFIHHCDFLGLSCYHPCSLPPVAADFRAAIDHVVAEFRDAGLTIQHDLPLHFSEIGIGGGSPKAAKLTPELVVAAPWEGSGLPEWGNPWNDPSLRKTRTDYFKALLAYLREPETRHPVTHAFLWNQGSWDPQGLDTQFFSDPAIASMIQQHNLRCSLD